MQLLFVLLLQLGPSCMISLQFTLKSIFIQLDIQVLLIPFDFGIFHQSSFFTGNTFKKQYNKIYY